MALKIYNKTDEVIRLQVIWRDLQKGLPVGKRGVSVFAKEQGLTRHIVYAGFTGLRPLSEELLETLVKIGYRYEFIKLGELPKKSGEVHDKKKEYIDLKEVLLVVGRLRVELHAKEARMTGIEKELEELKKEVQSLKATIPYYQK